MTVVIKKSVDRLPSDSCNAPAEGCLHELKQAEAEKKVSESVS